MKTVSMDNIFKTFKAKYTAQTHEEFVTVEQTFDEETGEVTDITETQNFEVDADMEALVKALISATLEEIEQKGLTMGKSKAKKMEVG